MALRFRPRRRTRPHSQPAPRPPSRAPPTRTVQPRPSSGALRAGAGVAVGGAGVATVVHVAGRAVAEGYRGRAEDRRAKQAQFVGTPDGGLIVFDPESGRTTSYGTEPEYVGDERTPEGAKGTLREFRGLIIVAGVVFAVGVAAFAAYKGGLFKKGGKK